MFKVKKTYIKMSNLRAIEKSKIIESKKLHEVIDKIKK